MNGRHSLQIPGPTNVPDRILRAMAAPTIDHRGPDFARMAKAILRDLQPVFGCSAPAIIYPGSGTGAWEAALVNTLSPGDGVLMFETGHFAKLWSELATRLGFDPTVIAGDWRSGVDVEKIEEALRADQERRFKAVCIVHNETSTGCTSSVAAVRAAMNRTDHPALLLVDTISSLGSIEYRHDEWGVDVTVGCSQKGLMLPPGLSFNAVSEKALAASEKAAAKRYYWSWTLMRGPNAAGHFPYTPATNLLFGLREALAMLHEEGLPKVFARHARHATATRDAVRAWGLETVCARQGDHSDALTAVFVPEGHSADQLRGKILAEFNMSLGNGLSRLADRVFRIGHLGDFNDVALIGTLGGIEMGMSLLGVPHRSGGVQAAMLHLSNSLESRPSPI
jgi:alanine-glyoxylate transaminase/serine-glyoxylate transaminase/serine-pyruvate transaminase